MKKFRRITAAAVLMAFFMSLQMGALPPVQAAPQVTGIYVDQVFTIARDYNLAIIEIFGSELQDVAVRVGYSGGGFKTLGGTNADSIGNRTVNEPDYLKFELSGAEATPIQWNSMGITVGGNNIKVNDVNMPIITSMQPTVAYAGSAADEGTINIIGNNLTKDTMSIGKGALAYTVLPSSNDMKYSFNNLAGEPGWRDIIYSRAITTPSGIDVTIRKTYQDQFRVVNKLDISGLEIYPNQGVAGKTTVNFKAPVLGNLSVFFLKSTSDLYYKANMGTDYEYIPHPTEADLIKVKVPNLPVGEYHIVLTNLLTAPPDGVDLRQYVTMEYHVEELFHIISGSDEPEILTVVPNQGPNESQNAVTITGRNFEELKIDNLTIADNTPYTLALSDNNTLLTISYDDASATYKPMGAAAAKDVNVRREIRVTIGGQATFQAVANQVFEKNNYDYLKIFTAILSGQDLAQSPVKDVVVEIDTILQVKNSTEKYELKEVVVKEKGFTFVMSYTEPVINQVTPSRIQVIPDVPPAYKIKEEMYVGITGQNYVVSRYIDPDNSEQAILYPIVDLGGVLKIERQVDISGDRVIINGTVVSDAKMEVYSDGIVMDGSTGKETGKSIIIKLPAELAATINTINSPTYVEITNPKKNSLDHGYPIRKADMIQFITADDEVTPVITGVDPEIVSLNGAAGVKISGYNFLPDVKLYLETTELKCVRSADGRTITFDAPVWREGKTRLLVVNPSGGMAGVDFYYVRSYTTPKIIKVTPPEGVINSLVVIDGEGFVLPDPAADLSNDLGIYRLMGSRVLLGTRDINDYNYFNGKITLQPFTAADNNKLLQIDADNEAFLADYYHSIVLEDEDEPGKFYIIRYDELGRIILTNGRNTYEVRRDGSVWQIFESGNAVGDITLRASNDGLDISGVSKRLKYMTPYVVDNVNHEITGNRVKVADQGKRILITIPNLYVPGLYDVTVVNPDTNRDTLRNGFNFRGNPQKLPVITEVIPDQGAAGGGYFVKIVGANFEDNGTVKSRVFINGIEVAKNDTYVGVDGSTIDVKVPPFPGDLRQEWGGRKSVPVAVLNPSDGGSTGKEDAFTYLVADSQPIIDRLTPAEGSGAGGSYVIIYGRDFRYYEPYTDENFNFQYDDQPVPGEPFRDINGDGVWNDFSGSGNTSAMSEEDIKVLPMVYFGDKRANIKDFGAGYIGVEIPSGVGRVDVYLVNNDYGISNKVPFEYKTLNPKIDSVVPDSGNKMGNEPVEILGQDFGVSDIVLWHCDEQGNVVLNDEKMTMVRFGDISNIKNLTSGLVVGGEVPQVDLTGGLSIVYSLNTKKIILYLNHGGQQYEKELDNYDGSLRYFDLNMLENSEGDRYPGHELVKIYLDNVQRRLIIERGFALTTTYNDRHILVNTPPYYTVGTVALTLVNADGTSAASKFTYKNPLTNPVIINITRDNDDPVEKTIAGEDYRVLPVNYKGGSVIKVIGREFIRGASVQIVGSNSIISIPVPSVEYGPGSFSEWLTFTMPAVAEAEVGNLLPLVITNEDGGVAWSNESPEGAPIYFEITKGETEPSISTMTPGQGPAEGGTWVKIQGKDFRAAIEGFGNELRVIFGDTPTNEIRDVAYDQIIVKTPAHAPGKVDVRLENPDGSFSIPMGSYTYISKPKISKVVKNLNSDEELEKISIEGGQEIYIKGVDFLPGAKVIFAPELAPAAENENGVFYRVKTENPVFLPAEVSKVLDPYMLKSGEILNAEFIDSETLKVTTPTGKLKTGGLVVVNGDQGLSELFEDINFDLPRPESPMNVKAELVHSDLHNQDVGIRVFWDAVQGAREYEVYVFRGGSNQFFVGSTELTSYFFTDIEADASYRFIVKAVGDFASSEPSGTSNSVRTSDKAGSIDLDGELGEQTSVTVNAQKVVAKVGYNHYGSELILDMTQGALQGAKSVEILVPSSLINSSYSVNIKAIFADCRVYFNSNALQNSYIRSAPWPEEAGVRVFIKPVAQLSSSGITFLSATYEIEANAFDGKNTYRLEYLSGGMNILMDYNSNMARMRHLSKISFSRYDSLSSTWQVLYEDSNSVFRTVTRPGRYAILGRR